MDFLTKKRQHNSNKKVSQNLFLESKQSKCMKKQKKGEEKKKEEQTEDSQKLPDSMRRKIPGIPAPG